MWVKTPVPQAEAARLPGRVQLRVRAGHSLGRQQLRVRAGHSLGRSVLVYRAVPTNEAPVVIAVDDPPLRGHQVQYAVESTARSTSRCLSLTRFDSGII